MGKSIWFLVEKVIGMFLNERLLDWNGLTCRVAVPLKHGVMANKPLVMTRYNTFVWCPMIMCLDDGSPISSRHVLLCTDC